MNKLRTALLYLATLACTNSFAQSKEFENVIDVEVRNTVEITNNKQIVGYAFFYKMDNMKKAAMYRLSILDENLKEIGNNEFEGPKELQLKRAVYESEHILLSFSDESGKDGYKRFVKVFDLKGKEKGLVPTSLKKSSRERLEPVWRRKWRQCTRAQTISRERVLSQFIKARQRPAEWMSR
jgi:hypothetical protein